MDEQLVKEVARTILDEIRPTLDNPVLAAVERVEEQITALAHRYEVDQVHQRSMNEMILNHDRILRGNGKVGIVTLVGQIQSDIKVGKWIGGIISAAVLSTLVYAVMRLIVIQ